MAYWSQEAPVTSARTRSPSFARAATGRRARYARARPPARGRRLAAVWAAPNDSARSCAACCATTRSTPSSTSRPTPTSASPSTRPRKYYRQQRRGTHRQLLEAMRDAGVKRVRLLLHRRRLRQPRGRPHHRRPPPAPQSTPTATASCMVEQMLAWLDRALRPALASRCATSTPPAPPRTARSARTTTRRPTSSRCVLQAVARPVDPRSRSSAPTTPPPTAPASATTSTSTTWPTPTCGPSTTWPPAERATSSTSARAAAPRCWRC